MSTRVITPQNTTPHRAPLVEIEVGLAFEFLLTLGVYHHRCDEEGYEYEVGDEWFEMVQRKATPELLATIARLQGGCEFWHALLGLVYDMAAPRDVESLLEYIEMIDPLELRLHMLGYYQRSIRRIIPRDIIFQAAQGDAEAQEQYLKIPTGEDDDWQEQAQQLFATEPEVTKITVLTIMRQWYTQVFRSLEQQVLPVLERDAEAKRALKDTMTLPRLVETATNGLEYVPEPGIRRVVLTPCFVMRPWNESIDYQDTMIYCYPVAEESLEKENRVPVSRLVRLYKALADERRLRILKLLTTRSYSLQELVDEFGMSKTTMHYHLSMLRTAGLLLAQPKAKVYSLRQDRLSEVSELLQAYLRSSNDYRYKD